MALCLNPSVFGSHKAHDQVPETLVVTSSSTTGTVKIVFHVKYPDSWRFTRTIDIVHRLLDAKRKQNAGWVRLVTKDGHSSGYGLLQIESAPGWRDCGGIFAYTAEVPRVALNAKDVQPQFTDMSLKEASSIGPTGFIKNPVYTNVTSLRDNSILPQSVSHEGVTVTLQALVTKTALPPRKGLSGASLKQLLQAGRFLRPKGTPDDPYYSAAVFTISEGGTSVSQWDATDVKVFYGQPEIELTQLGILYVSYMPVMKTANPNEQVVFMSHIGMPNQPVKLRIRLKRSTAFPEDEIEIIEIPIPTTGTVSGPHKLKRYWDGTEPLLFVSNGAAIRHNLRSFGSSNFSLLVGIHGKQSSIDVVAATLQSDEAGTTDIMDFKGRPSSSEEFFGISFDVRRTPGFNERAPLDLSSYTTLTLSVAVPRKFGHTFEFIAAPPAATVPAAPKR